MTPPWKQRAGQGILALNLSRNRLSGVELRRTNGHAEVRTAFDVPLDSPLLDGAPDAAGQRLRKALDAAGVRERDCAVCLPQELALAVPVAIPDIPEEDLPSFLQIEAERGFPQSPEDLLVQHSAEPPGTPDRHACLLGVPRDALDRLDQILRAARLRPLRFTLGTAALVAPNAQESQGTLALLPAGTGLALQIVRGGAVAALRVIDAAFAPDTPTAEPATDHILRELRITLGQLPAPTRSDIRRVLVFGRSDAARTTAAVLQPRLAPWGLEVEWKPDLPAMKLPFQRPADAPATPALAVALAVLAGHPPAFEFLPPRVSAWQQFSQRYASRRLALGGLAAASVAAAVALLFLGQQMLLWRWQGRWDAIKVQVGKLESIQKEIRLYRPWFDDSVRSLGILRRLTESFPEDGSVSAKSIEMRPDGRVVCSGTARDNQAWLRMLDQMRNARGITDVQVGQVRGKSPIEYTFNFRWEGPGGS